MPRASRILVILRGGARDLPPDWTRGRGRFALIENGRVSDRVAPPDGVEAVLYEVDDAGRTAAPLRDLRRLADGAPLVPFRLERERRTGRRRGSRDGATEALPLRRSTDMRLLSAVLDRERQLTDQRQRVRRAALDARDATAHIAALAAIVRVTGSELDPHRIVDVVMERVGQFLNLRAWLFFLADPEQGLLSVERAHGEGMSALRGRRVPLGEGAAGRAAQRRQPVILEAADPADLGLVDAPKTATGRPLLAVPLLSRGRLIGVLAALDRDRGGPFTNQDARLLSLLLEPAAVAIDNAVLLRKSEELSVTDDLTKLFNSRYLNATLRREVERSKRYRTPVSLIFLDLDGFKAVNDQHGHLWGSRTLQEVGRVIGSTVREIDVVARFGGDEFTVILPQTGPEGAAIIAERIRQKIEETTFLASYGLSVRITGSLGIACFPDHGRTKDDLLARADQAMYIVKGRGKNGVALAETETPRPAMVRTVR